MNTCKTCFHKHVCLSFNILKDSEMNATPCENYLDENLVVCLPCTVGTPVYELSVNCAKCKHYKEHLYSDFVECEKEHELFPNGEPLFSECKENMEVSTLTFETVHAHRYGKDIFLTENVAFLHFAQDLYCLAGYRYGKSTYLNDVQHTINWEKSITIVFPEHITKIADGFIQGFFEEIREHWTVKDVDEKLIVVSAIPNLKNTIIQSLL